MPAKTRDKERDRDAESSRPREKHRHKSTRSSHKTRKASTPSEQSTTNSSPSAKRRASIPESKSDRVAPSDSPSNNRSSLPYPSFSKAHSKETVGSRDDVVNPRLSYYTPDPTDLEHGKPQNMAEEHRKSAGVAPPSPPETTMDQRSKADKHKVDTIWVERKRTDLQKAADELKRRLGRSSSSSEVGKDHRSDSIRSRNSQRESLKDERRSGPSSAQNSKPGTPSKLKPKTATVEDATSSIAFRKISSSMQSSGSKSEAPTESTDSDATSIAPNQPTNQRLFTPQPDRDSSLTFDAESEPKTPTAFEPHYPPSRKETPAFSVNGGAADAVVFDESPVPPPPPPPPPPNVPMPKVDYLMKNGGLPQEVPRSLLAVGQPQPALSTASTSVERFFGPFKNVLDEYMNVMSRNGSLAVATGYRSVARRLLDRLEAVFARDISSETCECILCQNSSTYDQDSSDKRGVSWGEILEYVCGRQDLPQWPPFLIDNFGLGLSGLEQVAPMQKLDIDVPDEFRAHYIRQSKKTKQSVDRWLESQPINPTSPPQDVDDETLTFAMLTRLETEQRPTFKSLLGVPPSRPPSAAAGSPLLSNSPDLLQKTGLAIQRLYRLASPPRDPESAMFLLTNPHLHNVLATLAAVSDHEWDILISGRFDGFLRSGADDVDVPTMPPLSRGPSRGPTPSVRMTASTPLQPRGQTPFASSTASQGAPVALDEETEIAVLAEVEREIYLGMEALEDAFEALHQKAETVRSVLRERGAGLAQANQRRRCGSFSSALDVRVGTPASGLGFGAWESETDDGIDDMESELAPDDSASNVSRSRVRRPKRRNERRTPAPVEEEDEENNEIVEGGKPGRG